MTAVDAKSGEELWKFDLREATGFAEVHGRMLVSGDTLYVPSDSETGGHVWAINTRNGTERWRATTDRAGQAGGFSTDLVLAGDTIVTLTALHELVAIDRKTGAVRWVRALGGDGQRRLSAAVAGSRVYCTDGADLVVVKLEDGSVIARHPMGAAAATSVLVSGERVYVGLEDKRLAAFGAADGKLAGAVTLPHRPVWLPKVIGSTVLVLTTGDEVVAADSDLRKVLWRRGTDGEWNSPRIEEWRGYALAGDDRGVVAAIDVKTGEVARTFQVTGTVRGIGVTPDVLYVGTLGGDVFAVH